MMNISKYCLIFGICWLMGTTGVGSAGESEDPVIFNNNNIYAVYNGPQAPTVFRLRAAAIVTSITTYHWNNAKGATPGTIALRDGSGRIYGPWRAVGSPGQGGVRNAYWTVSPNIRVGPGDIAVVDSEPATWSQNSASASRGMAIVRGRAAAGPATTPSPVSTPAKPNAKVDALTENRSKKNVLIWVAGKEPKTPMDVLNYHLEPGWKGSLPVTIPADGKIKFIAGDGSAGPGSRYDKAIANCVWSGDPKTPGRFPHIIFEPSGSLTCSTSAK